jgi:beta-ureidopropionase / N-carbamoyl-L-amino-acid hydrolase
MRTGPEIERADIFLRRLRERSFDPPGVTRASYGEGEQLAHDMMREWAGELELEVATDYAGNQYMTLPGRNRSAPRIMIGSHMDSVPHGGNYDGAAGVVAGMTALHRMRKSGVIPNMDVTVMAIRAEELSWFPAPYIGSRAAFGILPQSVLDQVVRFDTNRPLAVHMKEAGFDPDDLRAGKRYLRAADIRTYIEVHIEQGPHLVQIGKRCAVVTGIRGNHRYKYCRVMGEYGHAGAVPRADRRDALFAAVEFAAALESMWKRRESAGQDLVCTVGQFYTDSAVHTITKIPGEVRFTMDYRSYDENILADCHRELSELAKHIGQERRVSIELGEYTRAQAAVMDASLVALARRTAQRLGIDAPDMASGAGHDCAVFANEGVPCAMIFIRNDGGSHNPNEEMDIEDFSGACALLHGMLDEMIAS